MDTTLTQAPAPGPAWRGSPAAADHRWWLSRGARLLLASAWIREGMAALSRRVRALDAR